MPLPDYEQIRGEQRAFIMALKERRRVFRRILRELRIREPGYGLVADTGNAAGGAHHPARRKSWKKSASTTRCCPAPASFQRRCSLKSRTSTSCGPGWPRLVDIEHSVVPARWRPVPIQAAAEEGRSEEDRTSTVHYVRFTVPVDLQGALRQGGAGAGGGAPPLHIPKHSLRRDSHCPRGGFPKARTPRRE